MKNTFYETSKTSTLVKESSVFHGQRLRALRNILIRNPEEIAEVLTISVNTLKNIESGKNAGIESICELIFFYGYSLKEFYSMTKLPTKEELFRRIEKFHSKIGSDTYKIIYENPKLIALIEFELLNTELFETWVTEKEVVKYCLENYKYEYTQAAKTLNNAFAKGWLTKDEKSKPKRWKVAAKLKLC